MIDVSTLIDEREALAVRRLVRRHALLVGYTSHLVYEMFWSQITICALLQAIAQWVDDEGGAFRMEQLTCGWLDAE